MHARTHVSRSQAANLEAVADEKFNSKDVVKTPQTAAQSTPSPEDTNAVHRDDRDTRERERERESRGKGGGQRGGEGRGADAKEGDHCIGGGWCGNTDERAGLRGGGEGGGGGGGKGGGGEPETDGVGGVESGGPVKVERLGGGRGEEEEEEEDEVEEEVLEKVEDCNAEALAAQNRAEALYAQLYGAAACADGRSVRSVRSTAAAVGLETVLFSHASSPLNRMSYIRLHIHT